MDSSMMTKDQTEGKVFDLIRQIESSMLVVSDFYYSNKDVKVKDFSKELKQLFEMYKSDPICRTFILKRFLMYICEYLEDRRSWLQSNIDFSEMNDEPLSVSKNMERNLSLLKEIEKITSMIFQDLKKGFYEELLQKGDFIEMTVKEKDEYKSGKYIPIYNQIIHAIELQHENPNYKSSEEWNFSEMVAFLHHIGVFNMIRSNTQVNGISNNQLGILFEPVIKQSSSNITRTLNRLDSLEISIHDGTGAKSFEKVRNHLKKFNLYNKEQDK